MGKIPLNLLESFAVFSEASNMRDAASQLQISQPALSQQLKLLQTYFAHDLLVVSGKKKLLTAYGKDVLLSFKDHLAAIPTVINEVNRKYQNPNEITVRISGRLEILRRLMDEVSFKGHIHYMSRGSDSAIRDLLDRKIDIAISNERPDSLHISCKPLLKDQFCLVFPKKWKISAKNLDGLYLRLKDHPYIGYSEQISSKFSFIKQSAHRSIEDWTQIIKFIENGSGWSVVPNSFRVSDKTCEVVTLKDQPFPDNQFYILYSKDSLKFDWFKDLIGQASKCFEK